MTDSSPPEESGPGQLAEEAAVWFARMRGPEAEEHRPTFDAWLARGALHLRAYNRAAEIFSDGKFLDGLDDVASSDQHPRYRLLAAGLVSICVVTLIGWAVLARPAGLASAPSVIARVSPTGNRLAAIQEFSTRPDETRHERLADGSSVTLQPGTAISVSIDEKGRTLFLERGGARVDVSDERRPFVVFAGGGTITGFSTLFDVQFRPNRAVVVRLTRGNADVRMPPAGDRMGTMKRLLPGESVSFVRPQPAPSPLAASMRTTPAVTSDRPVLVREFERVRVADLIAEANSQGRVRLRLADSQLGERTVSGRFRINDASRLADRLASIFGQRVDRTDPSQIVLTAQ